MSIKEFFAEPALRQAFMAISDQIFDYVEGNLVQNEQDKALLELIKTQLDTM
jgi:hypothetical protein